MAAQNVSGRQMVKYDKTKSDPLCKWRRATVNTVVELVQLLPKQRMTKQAFRDAMSGHYGKAFFRTPYQLTLQLGLYFEDNQMYIPRFDHNINENEAREYMKKWISLYYVPNPFTKKGFIDVVPSVNLLNSIAEYLENHPTKPNLATAGAALFGGEMGNIECVKYVLNEYSNIVSVDNNYNMKLLDYNYGATEVPNDRNDKMAFFNHFN